MPLFKKKVKAVIPEPPKMPPYPEVSELKESLKQEIPELKEDLPELPELPEGIDEKDESAEEIFKEIEREEEAEKAAKMPKIKENLVQELSEKPALPKLFKTGKKVAREGGISKEAMEEKAKALFIKIDKFKEILASIELMEKKAAELEEIIRRLREVKAKEEELMTNWQKEIEELKVKVVSIEKALSEKVE